MNLIRFTNFKTLPFSWGTNGFKSLGRIFIKYNVHSQYISFRWFLFNVGFEFRPINRIWILFFFFLVWFFLLGFVNRQFVNIFLLGLLAVRYVMLFQMSISTERFILVIGFVICFIVIWLVLFSFFLIISIIWRTFESFPFFMNFLSINIVCTKVRLGAAGPIQYVIKAEW